MFWALKTASGLSAWAVLNMALKKSTTPASEKEKPARNTPETKRTTKRLLSQRIVFRVVLKLFLGPLDWPKERL
ncbi:MAG: hypothetical protein HY446_00725 [Candidatus Niyogibacteria bacterium]|nr:hypothetical protein [Candidatus Niyogibacteria bacterium]